MSGFFDSLVVALATMARLRPQIEKAIRIGGETHTFDDLARAVGAGKLFALCRDDAVLFVEKITYPQGVNLHVWIAAGNLDTILDLDATDLTQAARSLGADRVTLTGRKGWQRVLSDRGWNQVAIRMVRPVETQDGLHK